MDTGPETRRTVVSNSQQEIMEVERDEYLTEFSRLAEMAKYPPFSMPRSSRDSNFLVALSREFDSFVNREKAYNSFDDVMEEYADEVMIAMSWMALGYTPVDAAFEMVKKEMSSSGATPTTLDSSAMAVVKRTITSGALSEEPILPWAFA